MANTSIRGKEWVFNALWSSCSSSRSCSLQIPVTILFKDGLPFKSLFTDSQGLVKRIDLETVEIDRFRVVQGFNGEYVRKFMAMKRLLEEYSIGFGYGSIQNLEPPNVLLAKIYYTDGEMEDLPGRTLEVLLRNKTWRLQVLMIQGYVPSKSTHTGLHSKEPKARSKIDPTKTATADQLTTSIAKYIERAYANNLSELLSGSTNEPIDKLNLHVDNLQCTFSLDHQERCIFLYADYVAVEIEKNRQRVEDAIQSEKEGREKSAADNIYNELVTLLVQANKSGLPVESSFYHFDIEKSGYFDCDMLIDGLARLGIGVTYTVAEAVMEMMGGVSSSFITLGDFQSFVSKHVEKESLYSSTSIKAKASPSKKQRTQQGDTSKGKVKDLLPPEKDWNSIGKSFADIRASQDHIVEEDEEKLDLNEYELPLPADMYTTRPGNVQVKQEILPSWARNRSKRALQSMQISQSKASRLKDQNANISMRNSASSSPTKDSQSRTKSRKLNKSPSDKRKNVTPLAFSSFSLQTVRDGLLADKLLHTSQDELLHLDHGIIMTYRVLEGKQLIYERTKTRETNDSLRYRSYLAEREENMNLEPSESSQSFTGIAVKTAEKLEELNQLDIGNSKSLTIVVIPDLTMTLDTLQIHLEGLINVFPYAKMVLVGLLGLPNTVWPTQWVLNSNLQARAIAHLVLHLHSKGKLLYSEDCINNLLFVGIGFGAYHLSRFVAQHLQSLPPIVLQSTRNVILINGFLKVNKKLRSICRDFRIALQDATITEAHELITSLHFCDEYLAHHNRDEAFSKFWETRRNLLAQNKDVLGETQKQVVKNLSGFIGLLEQLKGVTVAQDDFDGAMMLVQSNIPIVVVQGTENVFVDPGHASLYSPKQLPPQRNLVENVVDALEPNAIYLAWLKAGHELLQERSSFILGTISSLIKLLGMTSVREESEEKVLLEDNVQDTDDLFDVLSGEVKYDEFLETNARKESDLVLEDVNFNQPFGLSKQNESKVSSPQASSVSSIVELSAQAELIAKENAEIASTSHPGSANPNDMDGEDSPTMEKVKRAQAALERKKRQLKQNRLQQLEIFYQREREERERNSERKELKLMDKEDRRSRFAAEFALQLEITEVSQQLAREKLAQLKRLRDEDAAKKAEEERALQRSIRIEQRRKKADALIKKIENEELTLQGMRDGGYELPKNAYDINGAIEASNRILRDLMECRQKYVEAISRQNLMEEKFEIFRKQLATIENEEKRLRRAIRLIEINPAIVGQELNAELQLGELRQSLNVKQNSLNEMLSTYQQREQQLYVTNRSVQLLKLASQERDRLMKLRLTELNKLEIELNNRLKEQKVVKENLLVQKDRLRMQIMAHQQRLDQVERELLRIKGHKGKLIDTDIWMEGVMQRCVTKELKNHLKTEIAKANEARVKVNGELDTIRQKIFEETERIAQAKRDVKKVTNAIKILHRSYKKFSSTPIMEIAKNFKKLKIKAEQIELQRNKTSDIDKIFLNANHNSLVDKVRLKESEIRTKDERQFVALDLIINPEQYIHLSNVEIEQMQFDVDYQSTLSKADIDRILKLPEQVNLALPFLHTLEEISAHRLLNKFMRNMDESFFKNKDHLNGAEEGSIERVNSIDSSSHGGLDGSGLPAKNTEEAEVIHDILVRESLRDRLRGSYEDEKLSEEEKKWVEVDKVLAPHIYGLDDEENEFSKSSTEYNEIDPREIIKEGNIVKMTSSTIKTATLKGVNIDSNQIKNNGKEGDIYQPLRDLYAKQGNGIISSHWTCPYSRAQLISIHHTTGTELKTSGEMEIKELLTKYYVSDEESTMGQAKLSALLETSLDLVKTIKVADEKAESEIEANRLGFEKTREGDEQAMNTARSHVSNEDSELGNSAIAMTATDGEIKRIWGAWTQVHPASQGIESQKSYFMLSAFDASRDHPAVYGVHEEEEPHLQTVDDELEEHSVESSTTGAVTPRKRGMLLLQSVNSQSLAFSKLMSNLHDPRSNFYIAGSTEELAQQDSKALSGKICLLVDEEPMTLFDIKGATINTRQSRSHYFTIPNRESQRILEVTVSIVFQGTFSTTGYRLGRIAASLFRLPPDDNKSHSMPVRVGYSPYDGVSPNLPDSLGRIIIYHRPKKRPISPGTFQIIIGSAANTVYSIIVHAKYARTALPVVDEGIDQAKKMQSRLPICLEELDGIAESLRLAERKLFVCEKMIQEAESETDRCQQGMRILREKIEKDDEDMLLMEEERRDLQRELSILEIEYADWARMFASRCKEKEDIREGINAMYKFRREREEEKENIKKKLDVARRDLPACIRILRTMTEAVNVAMSLNTEVVGVSEEAGAAATGDWGGIRISTPAEDIRRVLKQFGFGALMLEEQQWCLLDQTLNPHKYEWLREKEEKERAERLALGKKPKDEMSSAALEPFKINKAEIGYILETPFSMLNRREVIIRKLLTKYHDDAEYMKKALSAVAYSFDPHLAERVRSKHPHAYSKEEKEWASVDHILHPEVWNFYVNRQDNFLDRHSKEAHLEITETKKGKFRKTVLGIKAANNLANLDSSTTEQSSITSLKGTLQNMQQVFSLEHEDISAVIERLQQNTHIKLRNDENKTKLTENWQCKMKKDEIVKIWRTPRHYLKSDEERKVYKLLQKYNGSYSSYNDVIQQSNRRKGKVVKTGAHIQWEKLGKLVSKDVDYRARQLLREIDRAASTRNDFIHSDVLHANDQKFPTKVLRTHLEDALDNLLIEQIKDRERAEKYRIKSNDSDLDSDDDVLLKNFEAQVGGADPNEIEILSKVQKRAYRRQKRKDEMNAITESAEVQVLKTKKLLQSKKTGQELADLLLESQLGSGTCLACRSRKCKWKTNVDVDICSARKKVLDAEIERIRLDKDSAVFESDVCLSAQLGGNRIFRRQDLIDELNDEIRELQLRVELSNVDKETHDAFNTKREFFESYHLHGYQVMLWTNNAQKALDARQSRLCALIVAKEVVDDILDYMLEGWIFGERQSQFHALGFVPSIKKDGNIRAGLEQVSSVVSVVNKMKERAEKKKQGILADEAKRGTMLEKAYEIELSTQEQKAKVKVARDQNEHEHLLNETENTLKFGLFMLTLMYFRAMTFLKREQKSWSAEDDEIGVKSKKKVNKAMTDERMRMIDEENKVALRQKKIDLILAKSQVGDKRRKEREAQERKEAISKMQAVIRRQKLESMSIGLIQKVYRGHIGRKVAKRWALKRAELGAMNALLNATAITIQRVYRGYKGRCYAIVKRQEMAQFIALMRVQESAQDEEVYWQTHPWSRFKKRQKEWMAEKMEKYRAKTMLGASRLSAEEQAELEGRALEEIKREIEGLDVGAGEAGSFADDDFDDEDEENFNISASVRSSMRSELSSLNTNSRKSKKNRRGSEGSVMSRIEEEED